MRSVRRRSLLIIADTHRGGLALAARAEAQWFATRGWSVAIAAPGDIAAAGVTSRILEIPYRTTDIFGMVRAAQASRRLIKEVRPSVVHAHGTRSLFVARLARAPAYLTLHGLPSDGSRVVRMLRRAGVRVAGALATTAFSVSPERCERGWSFSAHASPRLASLREVAIDTSESPMFLWVGGLHGSKQPEMFVEALAEASLSKPMRGMIVGSGPRQRSVSALVQRLAAPIEVAPFTEHIGPFYERSTAVVLTSLSEGVPFVVEEAMWSGRAVIASDLPGTRWLLGEAGRLVRSREELVEALIAFSDPAIASLSGRECRARVQRILTPDSPWPEVERAFLAGSVS
jgi:glycosyltransferase involved in cell wall biosynthesis